jgi:hypothetical protein
MAMLFMAGSMIQAKRRQHMNRRATRHAFSARI